jgi:hypothetical protein
MLMFACRRTSKSQSLKKLQKTLTFRLDYQRQISLDLSHACRYLKRLISLITLQNFYVAVLQTCREYSMYEAGCPSISGVCPCIQGVCPCIQRGVALSSPYIYAISRLVLLFLYHPVPSRLYHPYLSTQAGFVDIEAFRMHD